MGFEFRNDTPIYIQIVEQVKKQIIGKKYLPNQKIPSVREFSMDFEVNPNTVVKALAELENEGLIYTERTNGKFVTGDEKVISAERHRTVERLKEQFFSSMEQLGYDKDLAIKILNGEK